VKIEDGKNTGKTFLGVVSRSLKPNRDKFFYSINFYDNRAQHGHVSVGKTRNLERVRVRRIKKSGCPYPFPLCVT
jgi:hypothetical protein